MICYLYILNAFEIGYLREFYLNSLMWIVNVNNRGYNIHKLHYLHNNITMENNMRENLNTELTNSIVAADDKAQYDDRAKRLLAQKSILAHILVKTVDEFKEMNPKEVENYIEGEPYVSIVSMEPGLTNTGSVNSEGQKIVGMNTESSEINEGMVRFDIIFYVRMKNGRNQIIINLEIQKSEPTSYNILNRALFYVSRMVSSQKERDFAGMRYDDIKSVVSIWICMNMDTNCMSHFHMIKDDVLETYDWGGNIDMMNVVLIGIKNELPEHDEKYELHRLLGALLSDTLEVNEKLNILEKEYDILLNDNLKEGIEIMCNLSQGIEEKGIEKGIEKGVTQMIISMYEDGCSFEQIARIAKMSIDDVRKIVDTAKEAMIDV